MTQEDKLFACLANKSHVHSMGRLLQQGNTSVVTDVNEGGTDIFQPGTKKKVQIGVTQ